MPGTGAHAGLSMGAQAPAAAAAAVAGLASGASPASSPTPPTASAVVALCVQQLTAPRFITGVEGRHSDRLLSRRPPVPARCTPWLSVLPSSPSPSPSSIWSNGEMETGGKVAVPLAGMGGAVDGRRWRPSTGSEAALATRLALEWAALLPPLPAVSAAEGSGKSEVEKRIGDDCMRDAHPPIEAAAEAGEGEAPPIGATPGPTSSSSSSPTGMAFITVCSLPSTPIQTIPSPTPSPAPALSFPSASSLSLAACNRSAAASCMARLPALSLSAAQASASRAASSRCAGVRGA